MSPVAITFMVISMVTVWGGLVAATINLLRHPDDAKDDEL